MATRVARRRLRSNVYNLPQTPSHAMDDGEVRYISNRPGWGKRVYAICFDLDTEMLQKHYHNNSWQNAYADMRRILEDHGFSPQQGSVYFGNETVTPVHCVLAVQEITREYPWFSKSVTDIRMLRIEEHNDLLPAVGDAQRRLDFEEPAAAPDGSD